MLTCPGIQIPESLWWPVLIVRDDPDDPIVKLFASCLDMLYNLYKLVQRWSATSSVRDLLRSCSGGPGMEPSSRFDGTGKLASPTSDRHWIP